MAMALDNFGKTFLDNHNALVEAYNVLVGKAKSIDSKEAFAEEFMKNDPQFAEINAEIEKLESALESLLGKRLVQATPLIEPAYDEAIKGVGVDPEVLKQNLAQIRAAAKYLTTMYGDEVLKDAPKVESFRQSGGTSGGRRIRGVEIYIDNVLSAQKNQKGEMKSTFTAAAKQLEVETTDLQRAFFAEAGMDDVKSDSFPTITEFDFPDKAGETHRIRVAKVDDSADED